MYAWPGTVALYCWACLGVASFDEDVAGGGPECSLTPASRRVLMMSDFSKQPRKLTLFRPARALSFLMESLSRLKTSAIVKVPSFFHCLGLASSLDDRWRVQRASRGQPAGHAPFGSVRGEAGTAVRPAAGATRTVG